MAKDKEKYVIIATDENDSVQITVKASPYLNWSSTLIDDIENALRNENPDFVIMRSRIKSL